MSITAPLAIPLSQGIAEALTVRRGPPIAPPGLTPDRWRLRIVETHGGAQTFVTGLLLRTAYGGAALTGTAFASSEADSLSLADYAFDVDSATYWANAISDPSGHVGLQAASPQTVVEFAFRYPTVEGAYTDGSLRRFVLEASHNGVVWWPLYTSGIETVWAPGEQRTFEVPGVVLPLSAYGPSNPLYVAHRGAALMYPEHTIEGYRAAMSAGLRTIEPDVHVLSDGALAVMHDTTVDRTTTSSGTVASLTTAGFKALAIDANTWHRSNFGNALSPPLFSELVSEFKGRAIFAPEAKGSGSASPLVAALSTAGVLSDQVLVQVSTLADVTIVASASFSALYLTATSTDIATAKANGTTWASVSIASADSVFTDWIAAGVKTMGHTVNRRSDRDRLLALGCSGMFSDDPQYVGASGPLATSDAFAAQTWQTGMVPHNDSTAALDRGVFTAPNYWGWALNGTAFNSVLMGALSPIKGSTAPDDFTLDFSVVFDSANGGDTSRWASVFLTKNDKKFVDGAAPTIDQQGFHFLLRKAGQIQIYKRTTSAATQVANVATAAIADGEEVRYRVVYTPTAVTLHRLDAGGNVTHTASVADSDAVFRGGYVHLNRTGLACRFRGIEIS